MPKVELNLEDDELKELLLGDRDKAMQSIMAKILVSLDADDVLIRETKLNSSVQNFWTLFCVE
ncbi:hypothetical protein [uncultured Limosilactobacillus sp.]|uniref:hypothetical protein n=1 Tax=uncultured Limosilactobacillus sp. TaxID=2837629 RepID=UPI0025914A00|nr:hypothetical protein [uncultured Limosilactobacillus sp.]